jgi:phenylacetate-coenzyme A ligase PaaK-like adenylate-forming protein
MMPQWMNKAYWSAFTARHARADARLPYWPLDRIRAIQSRRVRALVAHAYETVPYYRDVMD